MDISSMTSKTLLNELKNYEPYKNQTDYQIKKIIGGKKLATVDELKTVLTSLSQPVSKKSKSKKRDKTTKHAVKDNTNNVKEILPTDTLLQTLLYSDINTIVNVCTSSKNKEKLCDKGFWLAKFKMDELPMVGEAKTFTDWAKQYKNTLDAQIQASLMMKIILAFNKYKGEAIIRIWYDKGNYINKDVLKYVELMPYMLKQMVNLNLVYDKGWTIGENQSNDTYRLNDKQVNNILTIEIYNKMNGARINFADYEENELYYPNLLKKAKLNRPIPKAYLAFYELLMSI